MDILEARMIIRNLNRNPRTIEQVCNDLQGYGVEENIRRKTTRIALADIVMNMHHYIQETPPDAGK